MSRFPPLPKKTWVDHLIETFKDGESIGAALRILILSGLIVICGIILYQFLK